LQAKTALKDHPLPLKLTGDKVKPTTSGNFISCSYLYQFHCGVSWGDDLEFSVPVTVYMSVTILLHGRNRTLAYMPLRCLQLLEMIPCANHLVYFLFFFISLFFYLFFASIANLCLCSLLFSLRPQPPPPSMAAALPMMAPVAVFPPQQQAVIVPAGQPVFVAAPQQQQVYIQPAQVPQQQVYVQAVSPDQQQGAVFVQPQVYVQA
jgi:hypothetical protein